MRRAVSSIVVIMLTVAALAVPAQANQSPPDGIGPWDVGFSTVEMVDSERGDRTLPVDVWYPVDAVDAVGPPAELDLFVTSHPLEHALADPEPSSAGAFPLVVFSHGSGGFRAQSWTLLESLASQGFVVVAPDHVGNTALDVFFGTTDPFAVIAANRPRDISFVIDEVTSWTDDPTDRFAGVIDSERIGVAGHSFGGFTALAVASGFGDYAADERVDAILPIAAAAGALSDEELASIDVPTFLLSGTLDETVALDPNTTETWRLISSKEAYRADVIGGGHNSFTNVCDLVDILVAAGLPPSLLAFLISSAEEGCAPELIDIDEAQRLMILYSTSFFRSALGPDARYQKYLQPNYAGRADLDVDYFMRRGRSSH
ncbi:MAG: alpha/beta fold hydrolase [Acidimicrobiia bacterium]|nr:alpha/beta fold hydrolase [Acidimicrobiia bacterium]